MVKTENLCLEICQQLLNSSGFDGKSFTTKSYQKKNKETVLEVSNGKYDIVFSLTTKENKEDVDDYFYCEAEDYVTYIENISLRGYHSPKLNHLNQRQLLSLFRSLALYHSKIISKNTKQIEEPSNTFQTKDNQVLENLYKLTDRMDNIDLDIFKQGVDKIIDSSKEVRLDKLKQGDEFIDSIKEVLLAQPEKEKFVISGSIFQKKILFKDEDDQYKECQLFNLQKGRPVSILYDMLSLIYLVTDQEQRQKYFHDITDHYYSTLKDLDVYMPLEVYEREINTLIPHVKLELVCFHIKQLCEELKINKKKDILDVFNSNNEYRKLICELTFEVYEHILAPNLNREDCFKIVKDAMGTNYDKMNYELIKLDGVLGLFGEYYKLMITVTQNDNDKVLHLFAKFVPEQFKIVSPVFLKEEFFYITFIAELKKVGLDDITDFLPRCYFVRQADVIVFDDLSYSNYRVARCNESFTYEMSQLVVKQFAKMHACSLLYEEITTKKLGKESRIGDRYMDYLKELIYVKGNKFGEIVNNCGIDSTVNFIFDQFPDIPKEISMESFRERARKLFDLMIEKFKNCEKYRNVICHGDIWGGNILFKFETTNPSECCFVDYQLIRYSPPTHDLLAFLYINTDKATRTKYMTKLIDQYYNELSTILKKYDFDLNKIYPYDHYIDCCNYMKSQAVCLAALTYPNSLDREKIQNMSQQEKIHFMTVDKSDVLEEMMKDNRIRARFKEIVEDLYELCLQNDLEMV